MQHKGYDVAVSFLLESLLHFLIFGKNCDRRPVMIHNFFALSLVHS